jgi:hypothetical protein
LPTVQVADFHKAIAQAQGPRFLLLGNGFSIAWDSGRFSYGSLYEKADFAKLSPSAKAAFDCLGTQDFELVMRQLDRSASLLELYDPSRRQAIRTLRSDAAGLRDLLVETLAGTHPGRPSDVGKLQYQACRLFLAHFKSIYTLNYDLLLYWTLMQDDEGLPECPMCDGFGADPDDPEADWVIWDSRSSSAACDVHYLHGALHLFDAADSVRKYTWGRTGVPLVEQVRSSLADNMFPIFVSEDSSENKMEKIFHNAFLHRAMRSLESIGGSKSGPSSLFCFGFAFSDNDRHVLRAIARNKIRTLWVGLFGKPDSAANRRVVAAARRVQQLRADLNPKYELDVRFFSSQSAKVWG